MNCFPIMHGNEWTLSGGAAVDALSLYIVPTTWPTARVVHWQARLRVRSIESQTFVVGCHAAHRNGQVALGGQSAVIGLSGEILAEAEDEPTTPGMAVNMGTVWAARGDFPALRDHTLCIVPGNRSRGGAML